MTLHKTRRAAVAITVGFLTATAAAETVVLDFATAGSGANGDSRYSLNTTNMHWWGDGYATDGVLFAWDHDSESPGPAIGSLEVLAAEGYEITGLTFDLAGYREVAASARYQFLVDGVLIDSGDLDFQGSSSLFTIDLDPVAGSSFEIVIDNYYRPSYVGLDNISFNIVPAPGAMALLGLAGVVGTRRRRG